MLNSRDPRREDHTTCTAVAPDVVLTVRMYGATPLYGSRLVRKFAYRKTVNLQVSATLLSRTLDREQTQVGGRVTG